VVDSQSKPVRIKFTKDADWHAFTEIDFLEPEIELPGETAEAPAEDEPSVQQSGFKSIQDQFLRDIEPFFVTFPFILFIAQAHRDSLIDKKLRDFCASNATNVNKSDNTIEYTIREEYEIIKKLSAILDEILVAAQSLTMIPNSFITQLCSLFDILLSAIISELIKQKPNILDSSDRKVEYADLFSFSTIEEVKSYFSEKFVEGLIRKSRREQIKWLEGTLKIPLTKDLPSWPQFIEINERRNLITHTGGVVSTEYISNIREAGFSNSQNIKVGSRLDVTFNYYKQSVNIFCEIGLKLIQVVWRKIVPSELEMADSALIGAGYRIILNDRYELEHFSVDLNRDGFPKCYR